MACHVCGKAGLKHPHIPCPGPLPYKIPAAAKFRRIPADKLTREQSLAYSKVIVDTVRAKQAAALHRPQFIQPDGKIINGHARTYYEERDAYVAAMKLKHGEHWTYDN